MFFRAFVDTRTGRAANRLCGSERRLHLGALLRRACARIARFVAYLERAVVLPEHHPEGSRLYIDAAFTLFRRLNPDVVALVYNPALSVQKGCTSSLNDPRWYDTVAVTRPLVSLARRARDHWWKLRA